jgi:hypothetical protein
MENSLSKTQYTFKKSYGGTPEPQTPQDAPWLRLIYPRFGTFGWRCSWRKKIEVLTLIFSTDCSPIDWLQSVLKITRFENVFLFFSFLFFV